VELLHYNLAQLVRKCGGTFSVLTCTYIITNLIRELEVIHRRACVYIDIKPDNLMIGYGENRKKLYWVDFGIIGKINVAYGSFMGTALYSSINAHSGGKIGAKQDLEALGYMMAELVEGRLLWDHAANEKEVGKMKQSATVEQITPSWPCLQQYLSLVRSKEEVVDYDSLLALFEPYSDIVPEWV
jgi:serine/threonine protein kinase